MMFIKNNCMYYKCVVCVRLHHHVQAPQFFSINLNPNASYGWTGGQLSLTQV